jgi:hypothetical protein
MSASVGVSGSAFSPGDPRLSGRGNAPVRAAVMRQAQHNYGNRAVQRILHLATVQRCGPVPCNCSSAEEAAPVQRQSEEEEQTEKAPVPQIPTVQVKGQPHKVTAFGSPAIKVQGKTTATFDGGKSRTEDQTTESATGCKGCKDKDCVKVTGKLVMEFKVTTTVTLPRASNVKGLTKCQQEKLQQAIDTTLKDHEQEHVKAFETYNGTEKEAFELVGCKATMPTALKRMAQKKTSEVEKQRRKDAQAQSDALDPFNFDVNLDCEQAEAEK